MGLLSEQEYLEVLHKCDIALSLRNPNDEEHNYNFPSKILEYLSKSKLVISTMQYDAEISKFVYYSKFSEESLNLTIKQIFSLNADTIKKIRVDLFNFLLLNYSESCFLANYNHLVLKKKPYEYPIQANH